MFTLLRDIIISIRLVMLVLLINKIKNNNIFNSVVGILGISVTLTYKYKLRTFHKL